VQNINPLRTFRFQTPCRSQIFRYVMRLPLHDV
jgi:hypothetical protein